MATILLRSGCSAALVVASVCTLVGACHTDCDYETVPEGTEFRVTVAAPSAECPELVPLRAGDTLTLRAGALSDDGNCKGNASTGVPDEFPTYPESPFRIGLCGTGYAGNLGFDCTATAPDCAGGGEPGGNVRAFVARLPEGGALLDTVYTVSVVAGTQGACSCFTKIPITIQRL